MHVGLFVVKKKVSNTFLSIFFITKTKVLFFILAVKRAHGKLS
jgi:hypothetical protein